MPDEYSGGVLGGQKPCPKCRAIVPAVAKICATCGSSLPRSPVSDLGAPAKPSIKTCASCGSTVPISARICASCNSYFPRETKSQSSPDYGITDAAPTRHPSPSGSPVAGLVIIALVVAVGFAGFKWYAGQNPEAAGRASARASTGDGPTADPSTGTFSGSDEISALPTPAQDLLRFVGRTGHTVEENAEMGCEDRYTGSGHYPGTIHVSPADLGASYVSWTTCGFTFKFRISADGNHVAALNNPALSALGGE